MVRAIPSMAASALVLVLALGGCTQEAPPAASQVKVEDTAGSGKWFSPGGPAAETPPPPAVGGRRGGLTLAETQALWAQLDNDGDNHVAVGEVDAALRGYDTDGDGLISYDEFAAGQLAAPPPAGVFADLNERLLVAPSGLAQDGANTPHYPLLRRERR